MSEHVGNDFTALLNGSMTNVATSLAYDNASGSLPAVDFRILVQDSATDKTNLEYMMVTAGTSSPLTVTRGIEGTSAVAHADDSFVAAVLTAAGLEAVTDMPNAFIGPIHPMLINSTTTALTANRAYFYKFVPTQTVTVTTIWYRVSTTGGNLDFGIYSAAMARLGSTGSFAAPSANANLTRSLTGSVVMERGETYYLAVAASSTSFRTPVLVQAGAITLTSGAGINMVGVLDSAFPLPDPASSVTWDASSTTPIISFFVV